MTQHPAFLMKIWIEHLEMNEWLEKLRDSIKKTIAVDLQEITYIVGV